MQSAPLPTELRRWVTTHLSHVDQAVDVSWPRPTSNVWRVTAGAGTVFVKLSASTRDYEREVAGYQHAAGALDTHEAPQLLAANPDLLAMMSTPLPGHVVRGLPLPAEDEQRLHECAGRLLRRWHDHSGQASNSDRALIHASMTRHANEAAACLKSTAEYLDDEQRSLVQSVYRELVSLAHELPVVYRHGDYSTRNWLWDVDNGHAVIDFALSCHGVAADDLVWLNGAVWAIRPDLKTAYFAGYGRALSDDEQRFVRLSTARLGVSYLNSGLMKNRHDLVERGRLVLDRMAREYR